MLRRFGHRLARKVRHRERGQALILAAFVMAALIGVVALVVDVGDLYLEKRSEQNAADAAALAAAGRLLQGASISDAIATAHEWAEKNGYASDDDSVGDTTVTVNIPPSSGPKAGNSNFVEVRILRRKDTEFARVLGQVEWETTARSVAGITSVPKDYAIVALNRTACEALKLIGNVNITVNGAGIMDNSACNTGNKALYVQGNASIDSDGNDVVGGYKFQGSVSVTPLPTTIGHITDPLASLPVPVPPSSPVRACPNLNGNGSHTFQPGVYNCTINPNGNWTLNFAPGNYLITGGVFLNGNMNVTFGAGIYTFRGQGFKALGNTRVTANEAMFYIDAGCLDLTGNQNMSFNAPGSGTYEGIAFFQNRSNTCAAKLSGNAAANGWGTVYTAGAQIDFAGNSNTSFQLIADTIYMHGNSNIDIDFHDSTQVGSAKMSLTE